MWRLSRRNVELTRLKLQIPLNVKEQEEGSRGAPLSGYNWLEGGPPNQ